MKTTTLLSLSILAACISAGPAVAADGLRSQTAVDTPPALPTTPAAVAELLLAQPFRLDEPSVHLWRAERPEFRTGYLLVLKVDPALVFPRQTAEPVLYVGNQTAERINFGHHSGHVVALVPAVLDDPEHPDALDLSEALVWFGTPELPEQVDASTIQQERALAVSRGVKPISMAQAAAARENGGTIVTASDKQALYARAAELIRTYAPAEEDLANTRSGQAGR